MKKKEQEQKKYFAPIEGKKELARGVVIPARGTGIAYWEIKSISSLSHIVAEVPLSIVKFSCRGGRPTNAGIGGHSLSAPKQTYLPPLAISILFGGK